MQQIKVLVLTKAEWPIPPEQNELDLSTWRYLLERHFTSVDIVATANVDQPQRFELERLNLYVFPLRWSFPRLLTAYSRFVKKWQSTTASPSLVVGSDVFGGLAGAWQARRASSPFYQQLQGELLTAKPEYGSWLKTLLIRTAARYCTRRADGIRALNRDIRSEVLEFKPNAEVFLIGSRVDLSVFNRASPRALGRGSVVNILSVGALTKIKNQQVLIRAMPTILRQFPSANLVIIGGGPIASELAQLAESVGVKSHVELTGKIHYNQIPGALASADLFAFPSLSEGEPRAILEAQASGVPVVCSGIPGNRQSVTDGETGIIVDSDDPSVWAQEILRTLADHQGRIKLAEAAYAKVKIHNEKFRNLDLFAESMTRTAR